MLKISVSDYGDLWLLLLVDVMINVIDVDDNCFKFYLVVYNKSISENLLFN